VRQLLSGVVILRNWNRPSPAKGAARTGHRTLNGEFISAEGIVFGGSSSVHKESLLERKGRISLLAGEHSVSLPPSAKLAPERDHARAELEKATHRVSDLRAQHRSAELAQSAAGTRIAILEREFDIATGQSR